MIVINNLSKNTKIDFKYTYVFESVCSNKLTQFQNGYEFHLPMKFLRLLFTGFFVCFFFFHFAKNESYLTFKVCINNINDDTKSFISFNNLRETIANFDLNAVKNKCSNEVL